jgi:hypothetical protein
MKKIFITSLVAAPLVAGLMFTSCSGDKPEGDEHLTDSTKVDTTIVNNDLMGNNEMSYQVPSPGEMLSFIKDVGGKNNKNTTFLNSPDNTKNYADAKSKALNFGIYSCDLSYCSIFEIGTDALKYFKVVKQLGDDIGVSTTIQPTMVKRLEANVGNPDSLSLISDDIYFSSFETLQNGQQGGTLALVIAGGYVESLYIVCNLTKYDPKSPAVERVADQKYTLDNIIEFMKKYESDAGVKEVSAQLTELKSVFDKLGEKQVEAPKDEKNKTKVLGGGTVLEISADQYKAICDKVKAVRNSFAQIK